MKTSGGAESTSKFPSLVDVGYERYDEGRGIYRDADAYAADIRVARNTTHGAFTA